MCDKWDATQQSDVSKSIITWVLLLVIVQGTKGYQTLEAYFFLNLIIALSLIANMSYEKAEIYSLFAFKHPGTEVQSLALNDNGIEEGNQILVKLPFPLVNKSTCSYTQAPSMLSQLSHILYPTNPHYPS